MSSRQKTRTLFFVDDTEVYNSIIGSLIPQGWRYEWFREVDKAYGRLTEFVKGDILVLDMAFGGERFKGVEVLTWARDQKPLILKATTIYTAHDNIDTLDALRAADFSNIDIVCKSTSVQQLFAEIGVSACSEVKS